MALGLGTGFSGVAFPVTITVSDFRELVARFIEEREGFGRRLTARGSLRV
jgi:hypothetical protein